MEKKLFFKIDDGGEGGLYTLEGCMAHIKGGVDLLTPGEEVGEFVLTGVWMTEEEFNNLPQQ